MLVDSRVQANAGVSPVVAVIIMVGVTVILAAVIGTLVVDIGGSLSSSPPNSQLSVRATQSGDQVEVLILSGTADALEIRRDGQVVQTVLAPHAGDQLNVDIADASQITLISIIGGDKRVITTVSSSPTPVESTDSVIYPTSLVSAYPFNGDVTDSHGTSAGDGVELTYTTGVSGTAAEFDGQNSYATLDAFTFDDSFAVSTWVSAHSFTNQRNPRIFDSAPADHTGVRLYILDTGALRFGVLNGGSSRVHVTTDTQLTPDRWYHVVAVVEDGVVKVYLDGSLHSPTAHTTSIGEDTTLFLGKKANADGDYLDGKLDEVQLYDRALTAEEVQTLFNSYS